MAFGFITPPGLLPALQASTLLPPSILVNAWLIWLRLLFSTQTKSIFIFSIVNADFKHLLFCFFSPSGLLCARFHRAVQFSPDILHIGSRTVRVSECLPGSLHE